MRNLLWRFVNDTADNGSWGRSHASLLALIPAVGLLGWLMPDPSPQVFISVSLVLGVLVKHAVLFPICVCLTGRRQTV